MPLAGMIAWSITGIAGSVLSIDRAALVLFIATGAIAYLGMFISRFTGENFLDKSKPRNAFDQLFYLTVFMALLVFAIAIPFFQSDKSSLPLTVGILTGLMWVPLSWIIQHWVGIFHGVCRTLLIVAAWYVFPDLRFVVIPGVIVGMYLVTIFIFERRWHRMRSACC